MQIYNTNGEIFGTTDYPAVSQGAGMYYWDGLGWVGTKAPKPDGDFNWLKTSESGKPVSPGDISKAIYHGGDGDQEVTVRTTDTHKDKFAKITATAGFGSADPITGNFFAQDHESDGRGIGLQTTSVDPIVFRTTVQAKNGPVEQMRITKSGLVGIGTRTPSARLQVGGNIVSANHPDLALADQQTVLDMGKLKLIKSSVGGGPIIRFAQDNLRDYDAKNFLRSEGFDHRTKRCFNL